MNADDDDAIATDKPYNPRHAVLVPNQHMMSLEDSLVARCDRPVSHEPFKDSIAHIDRLVSKILKSVLSLLSCIELLT